MYSFIQAIPSLKHLNACYVSDTVPPFLKATVLLPILLVWYLVRFMSHLPQL